MMIKPHADWLSRWAQYSPSKVAVNCCNTERSLTYKELFEAASGVAAKLQQNFGLQKGDRVACFSTNNLEYFVLFLAVQRVGAILVPINFRLKAREVEHILADSGAKLLVFENALAGILDEVPMASRPSQSLPIQSGNPAELSVTSMLGQKATFEFEGRLEDLVMILYTSGTTGSPKGAVITHEVLFWNAVNTSLRLQITQQDRFVTFLPFFHTGGWNVLTTPFLFCGATIDLMNKFEPSQVLSLIEKNKHTLLFGVPTTMELMAQTPEFQKTNTSSLRYAIVGGEPMSLKAIETWNQKQVPIRQGFGLTEFGPNVFSLNEEDAIRKIGSIGFPNFYVDAKIVDDKNNEIKDDQVGELVLRGPVCMKEYWNNPKATQETIVDGWLHTGDLVRRDNEGYFYVAGRKKDMYISGGENVYPVEVEQVLRKAPGIVEVAVIGVKDEKWGESGKAFVVKEKNSKVDEAQLKAFCQKNLANFKVPKEFVFMSTLPKGDSGKILKRELSSNSKIV